MVIIKLKKKTYEKLIQSFLLDFKIGFLSLFDMIQSLEIKIFDFNQVRISVELARLIKEKYNYSNYILMALTSQFPVPDKNITFKNEIYLLTRSEYKKYMQTNVLPIDATEIQL